ncbi:MAG: AAA family ATPase [Oligoflexus sp.]
MARLSGIGVRRVRTLFDLGVPIALSPVTVLLGRNSVGKSTFARLLPLLRQSAERKKRGPILWFDDLVDFGTLSQTVTRGSSDLEFVLKLDDIGDQANRNRSTAWGEYQSPNLLKIDGAIVTMTMAGEAGSGATYAKQLRIDVAGTHVTLCFSQNLLESLTIGSQSFSWSTERQRIYVEQGAILPRLVFTELRKAGENAWFLARNPWRGVVSDYLHRYVHQNTSKGTMTGIAGRLPVAAPPVVARVVQSIDGPPSWLAARPYFADSKSSQCSRLVENLLAANIDVLLDRLDDALSNAAKGVRYLKPLRATAERYYRRADLAVSEIDPEGRNLAVFLDALSPYQLQSFRAWLKSNFDLDVEPRREGAQVVLLAKGPNDSGASNVADMGFGLSQVLPIAAQLWASSTPYMARTGTSKTSYIVIEQPELHLHPAFQAKLADVFAGVVRPKSDASTKFDGMGIVVETHSQHLVNRLGLLIEQGRLVADDVSIVLFEADESNPGTSKARVCKFDSEGVLEDWPFGFFEPDY